jgi:hypothetical protein
LEPAVDRFGVSLNQINALARPVGEDLRADGYKKAKEIAGGFIYQQAMGISSGIISWWITNNMQAQQTQVTDACTSVDIKRLENMIRQLQANIQDLGTRIQESDSKGRMYDHYSLETTTQSEGVHLKHTLKPTRDPNNYKKISGCDMV